MKVLLVLAHARRSSLTGQVADAFAGEAHTNGHVIEWADLAREQFDPVLREADEPDWGDPAMQTQLNTGILDYCGIEERRLHLLYGSIEGAPHPEQILSEARLLGRTF